MSVYVIAQISITDRARYARYQSRFLDVLTRFGGRLLAADERPSVREGSWDHQKVVLVEFPDRAGFDEWSGSAAYREIAVDRKAATSGVVLLVHGHGASPVELEPT